MNALRNLAAATCDAVPGQALLTAGQLLVPSGSDTSLTTHPSRGRPFDSTGTGWSGSSVENVYRSVTAGLATGDAAFDYRSTISSAMRLAEPAVELLQTVFPSRMALQYLELSNRLRVFDLVKNVAVHLPYHRDFDSLYDLVYEAYAEDGYEALWTLEGIGYHYARAYLRRHKYPEGLLHGVRTDGLPETSLCMLHAGVGMAIAEAFMPVFVRNRTIEAIEVALRRIERLCEVNSRPGYVGASLESLGLVVCMFLPSLLCSFDLALYRSQSSARPFFWHGVGRCIYLTAKRPSFCFTTGQHQSLADSTVEQNVTAGIAWAITLINMRHPRVFMDALYRETFTSDDTSAARQGIATAIAVRMATTPGLNILEQFCQSLESLRFQAAGSPVPPTSTICEDARDLYRGHKNRENLGALFCVPFETSQT